MIIIKEISEIKNKKLPEEVIKIPNKETLKSIKEVEAGIGLHEVKNVDELFRELRSWILFVKIN